MLISFYIIRIEFPHFKSLMFLQMGLPQFGKCVRNGAVRPSVEPIPCSLVGWSRLCRQLTFPGQLSYQRSSEGPPWRTVTPGALASLVGKPGRESCQFSLSLLKQRLFQSGPSPGFLETQSLSCNTGRWTCQLPLTGLGSYGRTVLLMERWVKEEKES